MRVATWRGVNQLELALAQERLARGCGSTALAATMHLALIARFADARPWPDDLFARFCRDIVERGALVNAINSEPDMGSPSRGGLPSTTAVRTPIGWSINGHKRWASLSPALSYLYVLAAADEPDGSRARSNFLVPASAPGVWIEETWDNLGMRATASHDVILDGVEVPLDHRAPAEVTDPRGEGQAWWIFANSAVYLGIAAAARDAAVAFARGRTPNGLTGSIADLQTIQHRVAEMELLLMQARTVLYDTAEEWLAFPDERPAMLWRLAAVKYLVSNHAIAVTDIALRVTGSAGLARSSPVQRFFRDVRTATGHPPMDDAALTQIGKAALGLTAPPPAAPVGTTQAIEAPVAR